MSDTVPAIPLWQPWASLVVMGAKRIETRHWPTPGRLLGKRVAIHATLTPVHLGLCRQDPFHRYVREAELPLGALVGTVIIDRCTEITPARARELRERNPREFAFGNFAPGRFAWVLRDPVALETPAPYRGHQGVFTVPAELVGLEDPQLRLGT